MTTLLFTAPICWAVLATLSHLCRPGTRTRTPTWFDIYPNLYPVKRHRR